MVSIKFLIAGMACLWETFLNNHHIEKDLMAENCNRTGTYSTGLPVSVTNPAKPYVAPIIEYGDASLTDACSTQDSDYQEQVATENLMVAGAPINVFKLLGVHEQGKLIDLTGKGHAIGSSGFPSNAFNTSETPWVSSESGNDVLTSFVGYDFGIRKTSYGEQENSPGVGIKMNVTSIRIQQSEKSEERASQIKIERSDGGYHLSQHTISGVGNGIISNFLPGVSCEAGVLMMSFKTNSAFDVFFMSNTTRTSVLPNGEVNKRYNSAIGSFIILSGDSQFRSGDLISVNIEQEWKRVDIINLPNISAPALVRINQSAASRFWRIIPTSFNGSLSGNSWKINRLELFDYSQTRLDDIQDTLYLENRDRDYAKSSIQIKATFQPFDSIASLSRFNFDIADVYAFTTVYSHMVNELGRPIVVGDILEIPSEMQFDHNLNPVRRFLEVTDCTWAADGYTTNWRPITYRFQASDLVPSQETRDIVGTADVQKYIIDDGEFFKNVQQVQTGQIAVSEANAAEAEIAVPEKGTNTREQASGTDRFKLPGSFDGRGTYTENGLPPDGEPYTTGFKLPDVAGQKDGSFFRLEYDPALNLQARLYKFSSIKNKWIHVSIDRRTKNTSHKPSQNALLMLDRTLPLSSKAIK